MPKILYCAKKDKTRKSCINYYFPNIKKHIIVVLKEITMSKTKKIIFQILKYLTFFALFIIMFKAGIKGIIFPFAFGFFYALVWCNQKVYFVAPVYVLAAYLSSFSLDMLYCSLATVGVLLIAYFVHVKIKVPIKVWLLGIYALFSQALYVYLSYISGVNVINIITTLVIGLLFMFTTINFLSAIIARGLSSRLRLSELLGGAVLVMAICCGLTNFEIYGFEVVKFCAILLILVCSVSTQTVWTITLACIMGIGTLLSSGNPVFVAPFIVFALSACCFRFAKKYVQSLSIILCELFMGYFLVLYYSYSWVNILCCVLPVLIYLCIPQSFFEKVKASFIGMGQNLAMKNIVNRNREGLLRRFNDLSEVFSEMDNVFRGMIKGGLTTQQAKDLLKSEIKDKLCYNCSEKNKCHRVYEREMENVLDELCMLALERKSVNILDIPPFLVARCFNLNAFVSLLNDTADQYKQYATLLDNVDASKFLIAQQLSGVSKIMRNLADEVGRNVIFDNTKENKIIDELSYNNIICNEAVIYQKNPNVLNVTLVVQKDDANKAKIAKVVTKVLGVPMSISANNPAVLSGWNLLTLKNSPKFDVVFGTAGVSKATSEVSGDCYSLIRIESDKFMMALCDGMGSGEQARHTSSLAMGLIENFYKAGFDNEIILSSVNNLLALATTDDMFSALDICVLDLKNGIADFIKLGASIGFIKHITHTTVMKGDSLPIGIVKELKPSVSKIILSSSDIIVLCTDGISDSFESEQEMQDFINNITTVNPQEFAQEILERALQNDNGTAHDDMTVLVGKLYEK